MKVAGKTTGIGMIIVATLASTSAYAANTFVSARGSLTPYGLYDTNLRASGVNADADGEFWGADLGVNVGYGTPEAGFILFDHEVEVVHTSVDGGADFDRTDLKYTFGYQIPNMRLTPFVGFRYGLQGNGGFTDNFYNEKGYFIGAGMTIPLADTSNLGFSLAWNDQSLNLQDVGKLDSEGFSGKISYGLNRKVAFNLKGQFFEADDQGLNFKEDFIGLSVTYTFLRKVM